MSVFIGNGQSLVLGAKANTLETVRSADDAGALSIRFKNTNANISGYLTGGEMGGLLEFQDQVLEPARNKLGLMAVGLTETFNAQHARGVDLNGNAGGDFFAPIAPRVVANAGNSGSGTLTVSINNVGGLQASDYELSYDGAAYSLRRLSDNTVVASGGGPFPSVEGLDIAIGGTPAAGDRFLIQPTRGGAGDLKVVIIDPRQFAAADATGGAGNNRNALSLAGLRGEKLLLNGSSGLQDIQAQMAAEVGTWGSATDGTLRTQTALLEQATQARDSVSGVNLDEEAANLMRYQKAYEAAAKVVQIGDSIIQTLLDAVRR